MMITTRRNSRINTDHIDEFHMEEFADRTIVVRAYRHADHARKIGYMDKPITPRMSPTEAIAYAAEVKPTAPVMWNQRAEYPRLGWEWRPRP
jgi:hypothetical protein